MATPASQLHSSFSGTFLGCILEFDDQECTLVITGLTVFFQGFEAHSEQASAEFLDRLRSRLMSGSEDSEFVSGAYCFTEAELAWVRAGVSYLEAVALIPPNQASSVLSKLAARLRSAQLRRLPDSHREDFL